jgi:protein phosphatase
MRVLGDFDAEITPDLSVREARPGDRWLLCSDGLSGFVSASTIEETLAEVRDVDACADRLVQLALRAGGGDNVTVIVADVVELDELADGAGPSTQATIVGAAATTRHDPTTAADGPAARAAALTQTSKDAPQDDVDDEDEPPSRGGRLPWVLAAAAVLILVLGFGGYRWTQGQYYVGVDNGVVTIFRGIPQSIGPWDLSTPVVRTSTSLDEVDSDYLRERVSSTIRADSLANAHAIVENLDKDVPRPTPSPTPTPAPTPTPTDTAAVPTETPTAAGAPGP